MSTIDLLLREMFRYAINDDKDKLYKTADIMNKHITNAKLNPIDKLHVETKAGLELIPTESHQKSRRIVTEMLAKYYLFNHTAEYNLKEIPN